MSYQRISSKTRRHCAAEGCHAVTQKKGRYGYMADIKFFPFPTYPLPSHLPRHGLELSPWSAPRQVHTILTNLAYDLNYI